MKVFVICAFLLQAVLSAKALGEKEFFDQFGVNIGKCGEELKVDVSDFKDGKSPDFSKLQLDEYKCLPKCLLEKFKVLDASGVFHLEELKKVVPQLPTNFAADIVECVKAHNEPDLCTRYAAAHDCVYEKISKAKQ